MIEISDITVGYIAAALWSTTDENTPDGGEFFDLNYSKENIHPDSVKRMEADCLAFIEAVKTDEEFVAKSAAALDAAEISLDVLMNDSSFGHDFWLTRAGHGAGFWDGDYEWLYEGAGNMLTKICDKFGSRTLYLGDDKFIHEDCA